MQVRILKPTKTAMQNGPASDKWLMEFVKPEGSYFREELMGRTTSKDMMSDEVNLEFATLAEAEEFAKAKNYSYEVIQPKQPRRFKRAYADNFL